MGEAIARLREAALAIRRHHDESFSYLHWEVQDWASKHFCRKCRSLLREFESGNISPLRYARELSKAKQSAERWALKAENGQKLFAIMEWLPPAMRADPPSIKRLADLAAKEALLWGSMFPAVEARVRALQRATAILSGSHMKTPGRYGKALLRWQKAFDELAPFIEEPPAPAATSEQKTGGKQSKRRDRQGIGGRPEKFTMKFIREVVAARRRDQKHARTSRRAVPPIPRWLSDYCTAKEIDIGKTFPQSVPGEAWSDRANRFWKAATKRLREAETNRH